MIRNDRVQFLTEAMTKLLEEYSSGAMPLRHLVNNLEAAIDALDEMADPQRVEVLRSEWWQLEFILATMLDSGRAMLTDEERRSVVGTIETLRVMLTQL